MMKRHKFLYWFLHSNVLVDWWRLEIRLNFSQWYVGIGFAVDFCVFNLGPIKLYIRYYEFVSKLFKLDGLKKVRL